MFKYLESKRNLIYTRDKYKADYEYWKKSWSSSEDNRLKAEKEIERLKEELETERNKRLMLSSELSLNDIKHGRIFYHVDSDSLYKRTLVKLEGKYALVGYDLKPIKLGWVKTKEEILEYLLKSNYIKHIA